MVLLINIEVHNDVHLDTRKKDINMVSLFLPNENFINTVRKLRSDCTKKSQ